MQRLYAVLSLTFFFFLSYGMNKTPVSIRDQAEQRYLEYIEENSLTDSNDAFTDYVEENLELYIVEFQQFFEEKGTRVGTGKLYYRQLYGTKGINIGSIIFLDTLPEQQNNSARVDVGIIKAFVSEETIKEYTIVPEKHCTSYATISHYLYRKTCNNGKNKWEQKKGRKRRDE